jgi:hypothetical protein
MSFPTFEVNASILSHSAAGKWFMIPESSQQLFTDSAVTYACLKLKQSSWGEHDAGYRPTDVRYTWFKGSTFR